MSELTDSRKSKDQFMAHGHHSPLTHDQQHGFSGLSYYEEYPSLRFVLEPEEYDDQEAVEMQTSTGDMATYVRWGKISFDVDAETAVLTLYKDVDGDDYFLPFADATSGAETYGAGRYLDTEVLPDGKLLVDFNYAYSPYCAYNEQWSCPLTPFENRLRVPIRAGEKDFKQTT